MNFEFPFGATPIDEDEHDALIPDSISTLDELNAAESTSILQAQHHLFGRRTKQCLEQRYIQKVHKQMFGAVWRWAGQFRQSNKNIGVEWYLIPGELKKLLDDTRYWINTSDFDWPEIATRFHHRLVSIHLFPNGNGRHARLMTELLLFNHQVSTMPAWQQQRTDTTQENRKKYILALQEADKNNYQPLLSFMWESS